MMARLSNLNVIRRQMSSLGKRRVEGSFLEKLASVVGQDKMSTKRPVLEQHGKDEGHFKSVPPDVVVWPKSTAQVSEIAKLCHEHLHSMIPFGTGTGLEGGVAALEGGVCVALTEMNNVLEVNVEDMDCTVEAGVTWRDLNTHLRNTGLWFSVDPGASASLGGMSSTGASGTNAVRYGTMKDNVLNLEVVLANGDIIETSGRNTRARKSSAGYNLTELLIGSEGTLGIITKVALKLKAIPQIVASGVCSFPDVKSAIAATIETLQNNVPMARIEFLDEVAMGACRKFSHVEFPEKPTLFLEFHGSSDEDVNQQQTCVQEITSSYGGSHFTCSTELETRNKLWKARHELYYACLSLSPGSVALTTDVCVPVSRLTEMVLGAQAHLKENNLLGPICGHVGDGNIHCTLFQEKETLSESLKAERASHFIDELALKLGGTCTGEHGVGRGKVNILREQFGQEGIALMKLIKHAMDPKNIMNPGKLF